MDSRIAFYIQSPLARMSEAKDIAAALSYILRPGEEVHHHKGDGRACLPACLHFLAHEHDPIEYTIMIVLLQKNFNLFFRTGGDM